MAWIIFIHVFDAQIRFKEKHTQTIIMDGQAMGLRHHVEPVLKHHLINIHF